MYQLRISIDTITPPIYRTIHVPESFTLNKLHYIIQIAFGWENSNIWCFWNEDVPTTNPWLWGGGVTKWDKRVKIKSVLKQAGDLLPYQYGKGEGFWKLTIELQSIDTDKIKAPRCIDGARFIMEDCGGVEGYKNLMYLLSHPELDNYLDLVFGLGDFDPERFDKEVMNEKLKGLAKYIRAFEEEHDLLRFG
jgi:hypothetical protein